MNKTPSYIHAKSHYVFEIHLQFFLSNCQCGPEGYGAMLCPPGHLLQPPHCFCSSLIFSCLFIPTSVSPRLSQSDYICQASLLSLRGKTLRTVVHFISE